MITPVDHSTESKSKLLSQYKDAPNINAILAAYIVQVQEIEDILQEFYTKTVLATATGQQLDQIGVILGRTREGNTDDIYRVLLYTKIVQMFSEGTINELISIFVTLVNPVDAELTEVYPASFLLTANNPVIIGDGSDVVDAINNAKVAGVGFDLISSGLTPFAFGGYVAKNNTPAGYDDLSSPGAGGIYSKII
jgi:hypothetical protein